MGKLESINIDSLPVSALLSNDYYDLFSRSNDKICKRYFGNARETLFKEFCKKVTYIPHECALTPSEYEYISTELYKITMLDYLNFKN